MRIAIVGGTGTAGRFTVEALAHAGHDVVVVARSRGIDVATGAGLDAALAGVATVIDASNLVAADTEATRARRRRRRARRGRDRPPAGTGNRSRRPRAAGPGRHGAAHTAVVRKPAALCLPASVNGDAVLDTETDQEAYSLKQALRHVKQHGLQVTDRFGSRSLDTAAADRLLAPTTRSLGGPPPSPPASGVADHFKCYRVRVTPGTTPFPAGTSLSVADDFENRVLVLKKPRRLCVPADVNAGGTVHPGSSLLCYQAKRAPGVSKHARVSPILTANAFGAGQVSSKREEELCLPATVTP